MNLREDYAVIAHRDDRVLLVKMAGYIDMPWRFPQGRILSDEAPEKGVRRVLTDIVCCDAVDYIRDTRIVKDMHYSAGDRSSPDPSVTGVIFAGKNLHFYVARFSCGENMLSKGPRVQAIMFANQSNLTTFLSGPELEAFNEFAPNYVFSDDDMDRKTAGILERLRAERTRYPDRHDKRKN
jgi:hypothetical protein